MSMIQQYRDELLKILDQAFSAQEEALARSGGVRPAPGAAGAFSTLSSTRRPTIASASSAR